MKLPFNPGNLKTQLAVGALVLLILFGFATKCHSAEPYIQFSAGSTIYRGPATVLDMAVINPAFAGDTALEVGITLIGESALYGDQPGQIAWRAQLVDGFGRFDVGLGAAYLRNTDVYNCGGMNFALSLAYQFRFLPITARLGHLSNAGTCRPNKGRDFLTLGWRF